MALLDALPVKLLNIVVFVLLLGSNVYTVAGPKDTYGSPHETYVTPSAYAFWIWTLIHFLLLCMMFYQFSEPGKTLVIDAISYRFAVLALLNTIYIWLWIRGFYISAFFMSLVVAATVSQIYYIINAEHSRSDGLGAELFVHLPFSLYHGWTIVLIIISAFQAFGVNANTHHAGVFTKIFVFLAFVFLSSTAAGYAFATAQGDAAGAAVIAWALFSIFIHQRSPFIRWSAFAFFILTLFAVLKAIYSSLRGERSILHDEERAPLISGDN